MKRSLLLIFAALAALLCAIPDAFATRTVIFDPPVGAAQSPAAVQPPAECNTDNDAPCIINDLGITYVNSWISCSTSGIPTDLSQYQACLWFENDSGTPANVFNFALTIAAGTDAGQELDCGVLPSGIATWSCPGSTPGDGDQLLVSFFANPAIMDQGSFFLAVNGFDAVPGTPSVVASVPEPGVLGLFGLGLLGIGVAYGWKRRRRPGRAGA